MCVCVRACVHACVCVQATVNSMSAFFMPPDDLQLDELTNATLMKLEQFRDRTSTGGKRTAIFNGKLLYLYSVNSQIGCN